MVGLPSQCFGKFRFLKPRYKRLVDRVFPTHPQDGIVMSRMEELVYYGVSMKPEKIGKIAEYFEQKLSKSLKKRRYRFVLIAIEAVDQLLVTCHAHALSLFVGSYHRMLQRMLECQDLNLQIRAVSSFAKYSNMKEDASYNHCYRFFVDEFCSMCHCGKQCGEDTQFRIRQAGILGIQSLVRKMLSDDVRISMRKTFYMEKIVPALLYNMKSTVSSKMDVEKLPNEAKEETCQMAEAAFRDLFSHASYGYIQAVIHPLLGYLDNLDAWVPQDFAVKCFKTVMCCVPIQCGHWIIQLLLSHLDKHERDKPDIKISIMTVLDHILLFFAGGSAETFVGKIVNCLLRHLQSPVDSQANDNPLMEADLAFKNIVMDTISTFAVSLPNYQKTEVMVYIMGKFCSHTTENTGYVMDKTVQNNLLHTLLKVATNYETTSMLAAFPPEFLQTLLRLSLAEDSEMRSIVQEVLHALIDRHGNADKLKNVRLFKNLESLGLTVKECCRQDLLFMKKYGRKIYQHILENLKLMTNQLDNLVMLYCTLALLAVEVGMGDILVDLFRLALDIQDLAMDPEYTFTYRCALLALSAAYFNLLSQISDISNVCLYVQEVINARRKKAPYMLPPLALRCSKLPLRSDGYPGIRKKKDCLFDKRVLSSHMSSSGLDVALLSHPSTHKVSIADGRSLIIDVVDSDHSSSSAERMCSAEEITVKSLKKMLEEDDKEDKIQAEKQRRELVNMFRNAPFEEIVTKSEAKNTLNEVLGMMPGMCKKESSIIKDSIVASEASPGMSFPDLFVY